MANHPSTDALMTDWRRRRHVCHEAGVVVAEMKRLMLNVPGTPRWNKTVDHNIRLLEAIAKQEPRDDWVINAEKLYRIRDEFASHWSTIYGDPFHTADLFSKMEDFHNFLRAQLAKTYADGPGQATPRLIQLLGKCYGTPDEQGWAAELLEPLAIDRTNFRTRTDIEWQDRRLGTHPHGLFHTLVDLPVQEMCLDPLHVRRKFVAAAGRLAPASDIDLLIEKRRWGALGETLLHDRVMADALFWDEISRPTEYAGIVAGIDRVKALYFDALESVAELRISAYAEAMDLQATEAPPAYSQTSGPADLEVNSVAAKT